MVNEKFMELRVVTGKVRFHYVNLFEPRESFEGYAPKFGLCVLIPKDDLETIDKINNAIEKAMMSGEELWDGETLENFRVPLRDGDVERPDRPEFAGHYFINAASKYMPEVVDENCFEITNPEEVYSGCYGKVSMKFFPYKKEGNEEKKNIHTSPKEEEEYSIAFETFWSSYSRRIEKKGAYRMWRARIKEKVKENDMISAALNYAKYCKERELEDRYIKHPATFLCKDKPFDEFVLGAPEKSKKEGIPKNVSKALNLYDRSQVGEFKGVELW